MSKVGKWDGEGIFAATRGNDELAPKGAIPAIIKRGADPKGTPGTGSAGLAVGVAYLAVATGVDHLVDEFGVARQDAPVDRAGGCNDLAVAAQ